MVSFLKSKVVRYPIALTLLAAAFVAASLTIRAAPPRGPAAKVASAAPALAAPSLGAHYDETGANIVFRVFSARATRIEVNLFDQPFGAGERVRLLLTEDPATHIWSTTVATADLGAKGISDTVYYGYRAWGPNWPFDATWTKGTLVGFLKDVDELGNRFNPNKLLLDPYAIEVSHDTINPPNKDRMIFVSGEGKRQRDSGPVAPKGIVLKPDRTDFGTKPTRPFRDEIIYEVHVRGLTRNDASIPEEERGTYAGAARKAAYLQSLGVTAVEFLPVQETDNDQNDFLAPRTDGANYWGYLTHNYFAPDRRFSSDKSPGGPTREFKAMAKAFHDAGIKVYIDVVYNHTGEGGLYRDTSGRFELTDKTNLLSWHGLDNASYNELTDDKAHYYDNTGVGGNFNTANKVVRDQIIDSLRYWCESLGVDGFRFDLAPVLGNACTQGCFRFDKLDPNNTLNRVFNELPVRPAGGGPGADVIAEPWALGDGTFQLGDFPRGWAEWNGRFRDSLRRAQNKLGVENVTPAELSKRFSGSSDLYQDDGRKPWHSVNFMVAHDGFTLRDLYSFNSKVNDQPWPFGPSDGGSDDNLSWDQGGDASLQRQAARNGLAFLMLSAGVPMITGGDEMYRTQQGNNNPYNLDSPGIWLNWGDLLTNKNLHDFTRRIIHFRRDHPALRPAEFFVGVDRNNNGLKDLTWYRDNGQEPDGDYFDNPNNHFLAYRIDGTEFGDGVGSIYVGYNGWSGDVNVTLPANAPDKTWHRVGDTAAWMEGDGNFKDPGSEDPLPNSPYDMKGRSVLLLIEK